LIHIPRWSDQLSVSAATAAIVLATVAFRLWLHLTSRDT
jgi:hypothetical protein